MLDFGLDTFDDAVAVVIHLDHVEGGHRAVALDADVNLVNRVGDATGDNIVSHVEGMATSLQEGWIGRGHGLHVAANTSIGDRKTVGGTGNHLAVGPAVDTFKHVRRWIVVRTKGGPARPSLLQQRIFYNAVGH